MLGALVLAPVLLLSDIWSSPQLHIVHRHPLEAVVGAVVVVAALVVAGGAHRPPPVAGGAAGGVRAALPRARLHRRHHGQRHDHGQPARAPVLRGRRRSPGLDLHRPARTSASPSPSPSRAAGRPRRLGAPPARALRRPLRDPGRYSPKFEVALQNMVFFYVPFAVLMRLLRDYAVGPACSARLPGGDGGAGGGVLVHRLLRVRHQDGHPQLQAGHRQRPAHLLHRQLGVPGPRHLRALPRPGDHPGRGRAHLRLPSARAG